MRASTSSLSMSLACASALNKTKPSSRETTKERCLITAFSLENHGQFTEPRESCFSGLAVVSHCDAVPFLCAFIRFAALVNPPSLPSTK